MDIDDIVSQVKRNCDVSNARNWGAYSICGLLIRLRGLYRFENELEPWRRLDTADLMTWIDEKERRWTKLKDSEFFKIKIGGREHHPFDVKRINERLKPLGFIYGAGYVGGLKPSFFLAKLERSYKIHGCNVCIAGKELARDLVTAPALLQGDEVLAREEQVRSFIWGKIEDCRMSGSKTLRSAFEDYGLNVDDGMDELDGIEKIDNVTKKVNAIVKEELENIVYHEIGERNDRVFPERDWHELVTRFAGTPIEIFTRSVKDVLADTNRWGMIKHIMEKGGSLGLYVSNLTGFRKAIFPEIVDSYWNFRETGDRDLIEKARKIGHENAKKHARELVGINASRKDKEEMKEEIDRIMEPFKL